MYIARSLLVLWSVTVYLIIGKIVANISPLKIAISYIPYFFAAILMGAAGWGLQQLSENILWHFISVFLCIIIYLAILFIMPRTRASLLAFLRGALGNRLPEKLRNM